MLTPVDINNLTKSTKILVVRLRRQQELTCVPNLSSKPSVTRNTSRSNYNLHTVCNVSLISNGVFVATENYLSQIGSPYSLKINPLVQITQEYEISPLI